MKKVTQFLREKVGLDWSIIFVFSARIIQALGGLISIFLVATLFSEIEQGFYYTFASIIALQVFFELGLNGIITQYTAHEMAFIKIVNGNLEGAEVHLSRLSSLFHFITKWFTVIAVIAFFLLWGGGYFFFNYYGSTSFLVDWYLPWVVLSFGTSLNLLFSPFLAFIEGLGMVKEISKARLIQQIFNLVIFWISLSLGLKLYSGGITLIIGLAVILIYLGWRFGGILTNIYQSKITERISYKLEIFPLQWKIALSWIGGYFIFQFFNPVLFATEGPIVAGQMGITLTILNAVLALSYSWISTKTPIFSGYIAQQEYYKLDELFDKALLQSILVNIFSFVIIIGLIISLKEFQLSFNGTQLGNRFLGYLPLILMMVSYLMNHLMGTWAVYLRCHKKEPLLIHSLVYGALSCISTLFLGKYYGVIGITAGYCVVSISLCFWAYYIFKNKKIQWH